MDLLHSTIKHKTFGKGVVTEADEKRLTVQFESKVAKFIYPDAFEKFISAEDNTTQAAIMKEIEAAKLAADEERKAEELRRAEEERRRAAERQAVSSTKNSKPNIRAKRVEGKKMVFFVFQGNTLI